MWGSAGTGKTLILMEALKIKLSKLLRRGRRVRILATTFREVYIELEKKYDGNLPFSLLGAIAAVVMFLSEVQHFN